MANSALSGGDDEASAIRQANAAVANSGSKSRRRPNKETNRRA